jgi:AraC-like DNA-binding protein
MRPYVRALVGAEISKPGPLPLAIVPHESLVLCVQLGRGTDALDQQGLPGRNTCLTGIRQWPGAFCGSGDCMSLLALLTPLGSVQLLESRPLEHAPRIRASLAELLDDRLTRRLESDIVAHPALDRRLRAFGAWLEARAHAHRRLDAAALRAARAAMRLCDEPGAAVEALAAEQFVSRRQLERDFRQWIGTSPRHLSQVARVQAVSRKAQAGATLADIAADLGFCDQAHMSRVVRTLTGQTPRLFARGRRSSLGRAFGAITGGGTVYL